MKKKCTKCLKNKKLDKFIVKKSNIDGYEKKCKKCNRVRLMLYYKTETGLISKIYKTQKESSKKRGHINPTYTLLELLDWIYTKPTFKSLFKAWVDSDYLKAYRPSIDRKDDYIGYTLDNIQLMSWDENRIKSYTDKVEGRNNKVNKAVSQFTKCGKFISNYHSLAEASRCVPNTSFSHIGAVCRGDRKTCGGFKWEFKDV